MRGAPCRQPLHQRPVRKVERERLQLPERRAPRSNARLTRRRARPVGRRLRRAIARLQHVPAQRSQAREQAGLHEAGFAGTRDAQHRRQHLPLHAFAQAAGLLLAAEELLLVRFRVRLQAPVWVDARVDRRRVLQLQRGARHAEDKFAVALFGQRPEVWHLHQRGGDRPHGVRQRPLQIRVQLGDGNHAILWPVALRPACPRCQPGDQLPGERRMLPAIICGAGRTGAEDVQGALIGAGGGEHLPGRIGDELLIALSVERARGQQDVAGAGPAEGSGEAAIEDQQQVAAC